MNYIVSDFIVQLKNAYLANRKTVTVPFARITQAIGEVLVKKRMLASIKEEVIDNKRILVVSLRYVRRKPAFTSIQIISKPSLRVHVNTRMLPKYLRDDALTILSTPKGIVTGSDALAKKVGGELLLRIR